MNESLPPTTTAEEDKISYGQRRINIIWEATQALIAIFVVLANIIGALWIKTDNPILANSFFLVIGFYFGRTNHTRPK